MARIIKQYIRYVPAEVTTFTSMIGGLVPASGASSPETKFLRGDATWTTLSSTILSDFTESVQDVVGAQLVAGSNVTISYDDSTGQITISASGGGGGGISDGDKGDITVSSSGTVWNIDAGVVTTTELGGDITTAGKALLDDTDASAQRTTLGLGTAATSNTGDFAAASHSHSASDITSGTKTSAFISDFTEAAQDAIGAMVTSEFTYTDGTPELAINSISNTKISGLGTLATQSGTFSGTSSGTNTGDQTITLTSDVTGSGTGSFATTIAAGAVSLSKMANMATASILGRNTAGTGSPEVLSAATTKTLLSLNNVENIALSTWAGTTNLTTLGTIATGSWNATNIPLGKGGTGAALTDPNADRVMFWDDSAGAVTWLTMGTNLTITGTTLDATGGGGGNSFETIAVSGQSNVVADSSTDTLTLVAGTNVTITTDAATDSITINASLSGGSVSGPGSSTDNALVRWDGTGGSTLQNGSAILEDGGNLSLVSTDAGASGGPALNFHRDSASPAASDVIGQFIFAGEDSASNYTNYSLLQGVISDPTNGSEDGDLYIQTVQGGTLADRVVIKNDGEIRTKIDASACEGVVAAYQYIRLDADYTLTSSTSVQKLFNTTTNGTLTLPTGTYLIQGSIQLLGMSGTSGNCQLNLLGAGTATIGATPIIQTMGNDKSTLSTPATLSGSLHVGDLATDQPVVAAGTATGVHLSFFGMFEITSGGTIIPSVALNTAAAATVKAGSYIALTRVGNSGEDYVGAWT